jgi:ketosteroid isomerase-like protein
MAIIDTELLDTGSDAFNAHDLDALADLLADDVAFTAPGVRGRGRAECVAFHRRWLAEFPDARLDVRSAYALEDVVVEIGTLRGAHTGTAPTGRVVSLDYVRAVRFRDDGRQASVDILFDRLAMLEQLGLA